MQVRVENIYYLLCYAWRHLEARDLVEVDAIRGRKPEELLARVLAACCRGLLRQGLDRAYQEEVDDLRRPRGKPNIAVSLARALPRRGVLHCAFDDLSEDVLHNRLVKAALRRVSRLSSLGSALRDEVIGVLRGFGAVSDVELTLQDFRRVQLHSNVRRYRFVLHVAELVFRTVLLDQRTGNWSFYSFTGNEQEMGHLFQAFVRTFLEREQRTFPTVTAPQVPWDVAGDDQGLLPRMNTDIVLRRPGQVAVIETKCYGQPLVQAHGGRPTLRAKDVYQLASYVSNLAAKEKDPVEGVLLYAVDEERMPRMTTFALTGRRCSIATLNLNEPWSSIHAALIAVVDGLAAETAGVRAAG